MSWTPFSFPFSQNDCLNQLSNFLHPFFSHNLTNNSLLNTIASQSNYPPNLSLIPIAYNQLEIQSDKTNNIFELMRHNFCINKTDNVILKQSKVNKIEQEALKAQIQSEQQLDNKMVRFRRRRTSNKPKNIVSHNSSLRNDTKNIPKNYGKAMLTYIQKNSRQVKKLLITYQVDYAQFMIVVKSFKSKINTIHDLRQIWGQNQKQNSIKVCIRILSYHFMRKKCLSYIFNSRIKNYKTHIKYRKKIMEGITNPQNFTKIKQF